MKTIKRAVSTLLIAVAVLTSVFATPIKAQAYWYDKPVQFVSMEDLYTTAYIHTQNGGAVVHYKLYVELENSAYNKYLHMWYCDNSGQWKNSPAGTYVRSLGNNRELWLVEGYVVGDAKFAIHYQTDTGVDAWDNNNGQDYKLSEVGKPRTWY